MTRQSEISVMALNGSPHLDGNTATLMRWVLEGCKAAGATVAWIHVVDHDIEYCQGCFGCLRTGACVLDDDVADLLSRLRAADGIVVGSPVYAGHPTAQLKTLIDRITLLNLYTDLFDQQCSVGVATSGVAPMRGVAKELATFFGQSVGVIGAKTATIANGYQPLTKVHPDRLPARAHKLGQRLVQRSRQQASRRAPTLTRLWIGLLRRTILRPLVRGNADQFAGILRIWKEKGFI